MMYVQGRPIACVPSPARRAPSGIVMNATIRKTDVTRPSSTFAEPAHQPYGQQSADDRPDGERGHDEPVRGAWQVQLVQDVEHGHGDGPRCDEVHDRDGSGERAQDAVLGQIVQAFGEKLQRRRSASDRHGLRIPASQPDGDRGAAGVLPATPSATWVRELARWNWLAGTSSGRIDADALSKNGAARPRRKPSAYTSGSDACPPATSAAKVPAVEVRR
jgi:hypothetical protein